MGIHILQTMQWSKLNWDASWQPIINVETLLPCTGIHYKVTFEPNEEDNVKEGLTYILWRPPHSELNGWVDKRPSEILQSHIIQGQLTHVKTDYFTRKSTAIFEVCQTNNLINFFERVPLEPHYANSCSSTEYNKFLYAWTQLDVINKAVIKDYIYLNGQYGETTLEAILSYPDNRLYLHYEAILHHAASYTTNITKYILSPIEHLHFENLIAKAYEIHDNSLDLLEPNQVFGAEYW